MKTRSSQTTVSQSEHRISLLSMVGYSAWWLFFLYWFISRNSAYPDSCGAGNGTLVMLTILLASVYTILLLIKIARSEEHQRFYLKLLGLVYLPIVVLMIYFYVVSLIR